MRLHETCTNQLFPPLNILEFVNLVHDGRTSYITLTGIRRIRLYDHGFLNQSPNLNITLLRRLLEGSAGTFCHRNLWRHLEPLAIASRSVWLEKTGTGHAGAP